MVNQKDLAFVHVGYYVLDDYEIELSGPNSWIDNPPPSRFGVYEKAFKAGLEFSYHLFVLKYLRSCGIPLYVLTPNSIRHIIGFLGICFLAKV